MICCDWNHPSIILWGVPINESRDDHDFYTRTNALAHQLDATRPTGGIRNFEKSELLEDVFTINDFGFPLSAQPPLVPEHGICWADLSNQDYRQHGTVGRAHIASCPRPQPVGFECTVRRCFWLVRLRLQHTFRLRFRRPDLLPEGKMQFNHTPLLKHTAKKNHNFLERVFVRLDGSIRLRFFPNVR